MILDSSLTMSLYVRYKAVLVYIINWYLWVNIIQVNEINGKWYISLEVDFSSYIYLCIGRIISEMYESFSRPKDTIYRSYAFVE